MAYDEYAQKVWPRLPAIAPDDIKLIARTSRPDKSQSPGDPIRSALNLITDLDDDVARSGLVEQLYK